MIVGRITEVCERGFKKENCARNVPNETNWNVLHLFLIAGSAETLESGDQLSAGLCVTSVFCESSRGRAGEEHCIDQIR